MDDRARAEAVDDGARHCEGDGPRTADVVTTSDAATESSMPFTDDPADEHGIRPTSDEMAELIALIERHASEPVSTCALPRVTLVRADRHDDVEDELFVPVVCLVVQGVKSVQFAQRSVTFEPGTFVVSALDFPITGRIVEAPYRAVAVHLAPAPIAEVLATEAEPGPAGAHPAGFGVGTATSDLVAAMTRLVRLLDDDRDRAALSSGAEREVLYRALKTPSGDVIRRFAREGHLMSKVEPAISWIRAHLSETLVVEDLARRNHLSVRTLYRRFHAATGSSPLQFQKQLRLQAARKLLLVGAASATQAAMQVGYLSASQFSRDYVRMFGIAPGKDAAEVGR